MLKRYFAIILFIIFASFVKPASVFAAPDLTITCDGTACTPHTASALFSASIIWYPGRIESRTIRVQNTSGFPNLITSQTTNILTTGAVDSVLEINVHRVSDATDIWTGGLDIFYSLTSLILTTLASSQTDDFIFTISMSQSAANQFQEKSTTFDLLINAADSTEPTPTPTPIPTPAPTTTPGGGDGGGTTGGGTTGGGTTGDGGTTLAAAFGNLLTFFTGVVAGEEAPLPEPTGEVAGETISEGGQTEGATTCAVCIWWPILVLEAVLLTLYYYIVKKREDKKLFFIGGGLIAVGIYIIFLLINGHCRNGFTLILYTSVIWCKYFIFLNAIVWGIMTKLMQEKKKI